MRWCCAGSNITGWVAPRCGDYLSRLHQCLPIWLLLSKFWERCRTVFDLGVVNLSSGHTSILHRHSHPPIWPSWNVLIEHGLSLSVPKWNRMAVGCEPNFSSKKNRWYFQFRVATQETAGNGSMGLFRRSPSCRRDRHYNCGIQVHFFAEKLEDSVELDSFRGKMFKHQRHLINSVSAK